MQKEVIAEGIDLHGDKYVLCWLPSKKEFVSWFVGVGGTNEEETYYHGHYFFNIKDAIQDFKKRVCIDEEDSKINWEVSAQMWNKDQVALYFELKAKKE